MLVFLMLIYIGLFIIMFIAFLIHQYDRMYYSEEDYQMFPNSQDYNEFETKDDS